ncbi:MAG: YkgJ family cysteine cluster protein [Pirellula sp.]
MQDNSDLADVPVWYANGLSFECTQCGNCCSGPGQGYVWVDEEEVHAIATFMGMADRIDEFERRFTRRIGTRVSLVEYSDGDCIFLDPTRRTCTVYDTRPTQCRTWPFWKCNLDSPKSWARAAKNCPGCNHGRLYSLTDIRETLTKDD